MRGIVSAMIKSPEDFLTGLINPVQERTHREFIYSTYALGVFYAKHKSIFYDQEAIGPRRVIPGSLFCSSVQKEFLHCLNIDLFSDRIVDKDNRMTFIDGLVPQRSKLFTGTACCRVFVLLRLEKLYKIQLGCRPGTQYEEGVGLTAFVGWSFHMILQIGRAHV